MLQIISLCYLNVCELIKETMILSCTSNVLATKISLMPLKKQNHFMLGTSKPLIFVTRPHMGMVVFYYWIKYLRLYLTESVEEGGVGIESSALKSFLGWKCGLREYRGCKPTDEGWEKLLLTECNLGSY